MTVNSADLIAIRDVIEDDRAFIFSTWLKGLKYGNDWFGAIDSNAYYKAYHKIIEAVLNNPNTEVKVACLKDDPSVILGYAVFSGHKLHWVQVKSAWRLIGLAKSLIPSTISITTHLTKTGASLLKKHPTVKFNPFDL